MPFKPATPPLKVPPGLYPDLRFAAPARPTLDYVSEVLADNPALFFPLADAGPTLTDVVAGVVATQLGSDAVQFGQPTIINQRARGASVNFQGGYFGFASALVNPRSGSLAVEAWMTSTTSLSIGMNAFGVIHDDGGVNNGLRFGITGGLPYSIVQPSVSISIQTITTTVYLGAAVHMVAVADRVNSCAQIYCNGTLVNCKGLPASDWNITSMWGIGDVFPQNPASSVHAPFYGRVSHVAIYRNTLAPARVAAHYQAGLADALGAGFIGITPASGASTNGGWCVPASNSPLAHEAFTLACVAVFSTNQAANIGGLVTTNQLQAGNALSGFGLRVNSGSMTWSEYDNAGTATSVGKSCSTVAGQTVRTIVTRTQSYVSMLLNGVLVTSGSLPANSWSVRQPMGIGCLTTAGGPSATWVFSAGVVRDVYVFGRALTLAEVTALDAALK